MNFFLLYVALLALLFGITSRTPYAELNNLPFLIATTLATMTAFVFAMLAGASSAACRCARPRLPAFAAAMAISRLHGSRSRARGARRQGGGADGADLCSRPFRASSS
jgi:hypothetical protein